MEPLTRVLKEFRQGWYSEVVLARRYIFRHLLFLTRRSNISPIDPHDCVSDFALSISDKDYLRISTFQEEFGF